MRQVAWYNLTSRIEAILCAIENKGTVRLITSCGLQGYAVYAGYGKALSEEQHNRVIAKQLRHAKMRQARRDARTKAGK